MGLVLNVAYAATDTSTKHEGIEITVNVNKADAEEIATMLKGIGEKKAQDIVDYRAEHGNFKSIDDLTQVKGIGQATIEKNQGRIVL
ncbi:ComEA family DNA-binding protein [Vibrio rumoiensis]